MAELCAKFVIKKVKCKETSFSLCLPSSKHIVCTILLLSEVPVFPPHQPAVEREEHCTILRMLYRHIVTDRPCLKDLVILFNDSIQQVHETNQLGTGERRVGIAAIQVHASGCVTKFIAISKLEAAGNY